MGRLTWSVVCAVLITVPIGCSDDKSDAGGGGAGAPGGSGGGAAGMGGAGGLDTVTLSTMVTEAPSLDGQLFTGPPLEGVELCETDTTNCATTGMDGTASITLPAFQEFSFTLSKDGYAPYLAGDVSDVPVINTGSYPMLSDALMQQESERLMFEWPSDSTGLLALAAFPVQAGVVWGVDEQSAVAYYQDAEGVAQTDLTATTIFGRGGFYEVSEGVHEVDFGGAASNCSVRTAWPSGSAGQIRVPIRAGHLSFGSMDCDAP